MRYRRLFETAQDAILILDEPSGKILDANPFIKEMLGYSHAEIVGKEGWEIGMFRDAEENKAAFRELQAKGYIRYEHLPLKTRDGKLIEVEFVSNVYQVDQRNVIQCNIRDITERSRLERQTHEQAEALAELHHRKDEFLAMLSHELRNPLSAISSALHVLRLQGNENPIQQRAMTTMEGQVGQLAHLVDDLLEVSRVITGRIQLQLECLDLRSIAHQAVEAVRPLIERQRHELSVSLPAEPVWVQGDPTRLEQVVVNLLNNAAKYSDEGGHMRLTVEQGDGEVEAVLRVRDTGVGIAPELLPRIFDLFTQADRTLDRSEGGLGIGLSLVQKLVELHSGKVSAHSAGLRQGSEFIVRLPALSTEGSPIALAPIERGKLSMQTVRVLVVDDNVDVADMIVMLLQLVGHEAKAAYSGQSALETATEYKPDVVLLDIGMPNMNGYEVARRLRREPQTKDVRVIAMTGYGQDSDRLRSQEAGCDHHLVKPVDTQKLQDLLARRV
ncbi:MAG: ATP-binding protein [Pyrinomonadaceae bacterium]